MAQPYDRKVKSLVLNATVSNSRTAAKAQLANLTFVRCNDDLSTSGHYIIRAEQGKQRTVLPIKHTTGSTSVQVPSFSDTFHPMN